MVLTHGLLCRPFSTAFLASSAAPIITDGLDVLVHEVIAAMVTAPWSSSNVVPSSRVTSTGSLGRPAVVWRRGDVVAWSGLAGVVRPVVRRGVRGREGLRDRFVVPLLVAESST